MRPRPPCKWLFHVSSKATKISKNKNKNDSGLYTRTKLTSKEDCPLPVAVSISYVFIIAHKSIKQWPDASPPPFFLTSIAMLAPCTVKASVSQQNEAQSTPGPGQSIRQIHSQIERILHVLQRLIGTWLLSTAGGRIYCGKGEGRTIVCASAVPAERLGNLQDLKSLEKREDALELHE